MPNRKGPKSAAQTPAPKADRVYGSKKNKANSADSEKSAKSIEFSDKIIATLKEKAKKYNEEHSTKVSLNTLKAVFRRGAGAFSVSHRPNMTRNGWAFARVNKFLEKKSGKKVKKAYIQDDDLLARGGKINDTLEKDLQEFLDLEFYSDTKFSDISKSCDLSKGNCYDISEELMDFLEDKGYKNMSLVEVRNPLFDLSNAHYEWVDRPKDNLFHIILKVDNKFIDLTGIQFSKDQEGLKIYNEDEIKSLWGKIEYFKDGGKIESFKNTTFSSKSKDIRYSGGGRIFPSRLMIPSVRGGWTKEKILKYLKSNSSDTITTYTLAKFISDLDSWEELKDRLYYHGTTNYIEKGLKPSIVFSERWAEQHGGGGYGQRYWGISLTKRKRTAEIFSCMSSSVKIYPVFLKKDAKVIERPDLQDASEIEDIIVELYEKGIDAVYIGGGEEELVVVNPESIMLYKDGSEYFDVYGGLKTKQLTDENIKEIYNKSKIDWENYKEEYNNMETRKEFLKSLEPLKFEKGGTNFNDKELLAKWKNGESIGFTGEAHLKAKGLIPRADGTKRKSDKYMENGGEVELLKVGQVLNIRRLPMYYRSGDLGKQREVSKKVVEIISKNNWTDEDDDDEYRRNKTRYYFKADDKKGYFATFWGKDLISVDNDNVRYEAIDNPKMEDGGEVGKEIVCVNCGWEWNTDDSDESGRHWRCVYIDNRDDYKTVEYYDSLTETKIPENVTQKVIKTVNNKLRIRPY
jgi:hypothetical protein